ncbi:MAG: NAD(P)H-hydrate dehydratase [Vulcanimicrobiota bacterium]
MRVVTSVESQQIDRISIRQFGMSGALLMETAGILTTRVILERFPLAGKKVAVICGTGNNGGDGFVIARHLQRHGITCNTVIVGKKEKLEGDAQLNYKLLTGNGHDVRECSDITHLPLLATLLHDSSLIVDALFGTGLSSPVKGLARDVIALINSSEKSVTAVDIPSGIDGSTGHICGDAVKAALTVTMGLPKTGLLMYPGALFAGEIFVADIGFPEELMEPVENGITLLTSRKVAPLIPERLENAHKGTSGRAFLIAGSKGYTGAAALACESCLRSGAGLVTLAVPESLNAIMEMKLTETVTYPYPDLKKPSCLRSVADTLIKAALASRVMAAGPGIGRAVMTRRLITCLTHSLHIPAVLDADALYPEIVTSHSLERPVLTPHPGEMARLLGRSTEEIVNNPVEQCRECAKQYQAITILKGAHSLIATPEGEVCINPTGNDGMATAGMGDVLTGIIAGFIAQGASSHDAALLGVYLHGLAGDMAASGIGARGIVASDLISRIPHAIQCLRENRFDEIAGRLKIKEVTLFNKIHPAPDVPL